MKIRKLSIIVPVFNEKATVGEIYQRLLKMRLGGRKKEIIIVDDGSRDGSTKLLSNLKSQTTNSKSQICKFIFKKKNAGKGAAIRTALEEATGEFVIIQDADLEYDPEEIIKLVELAEKKELLAAFGSRDGGIKNHYLYPHYYWGSKALCMLMNLVFKEKFTDPETCYKLVQTDLFRFIDISEKGFGIEMEIAAKIARLKIPYGETAITYHPRSFAQGKKIGVKDGMKAIYLIGKYWEHDLHYGIADRILRKIRIGAALKYLDIKKNQSIVDMGCGRQATLGWKLRVMAGKYTGLDREVPGLNSLNIRLVRADLNQKLVLESNSADIIIGTAILEHLENPTGLVNECRRILKPGGTLAMTTPAPPFADTFLKILANLKIIEADEIHDHVYYFSLNQLKKIMTDAGMKVIRAESFLGGLNNLIVARKT
jgi:glycosyltransferase involved in cell wall biosynthesis